MDHERGLEEPTDHGDALGNEVTAGSLEGSTPLGVPQGAITIETRIVRTVDAQRGDHGNQSAGRAVGQMAPVARNASISSQL